jgi:hypothetical protein
VRARSSGTRSYEGRTRIETRSLPALFPKYSASSALLIKLSREAPGVALAAPSVTVTRSSRPLIAHGRFATAARSFSRMTSPVPASRPESKIRNSSPPQRATRSVLRSAERRLLATFFSTASPAS